MIKKDALAQAIAKFVGDATTEQLRHVESFIGGNMAVFIPSTGHCFYSISEDHTHPTYSFYYAYDRMVRMTVGGAVVATKPWHISGLMPGVKHSEIPEECFIRFFAIMIDPGFFERRASVYGKKITPDMLAYIPLPDQLIPVMRAFMAEASHRTDGSDEIIGSLEVQIVHLILRSVYAIESYTEKISERADIDLVVEYINDHYSESISLDDLSGRTALSRSHFSRLFKKETGVTLQEYIVRVRIDRAKFMLIKGDAKITEIAHRCGFSSSAHFTSAFLKYTGVQPSVYRKSAGG